MHIPKVWIYSRVSTKEQSRLLEFQKELLMGFSEHYHFDLYGICDEIGKGDSLDRNVLNNLVTHIQRHDFEILLIYDWTRISIYRDLFMEFKMLCEQNHISIFEMQSFEKHDLLEELR